MNEKTTSSKSIPKRLKNKNSKPLFVSSISEEKQSLKIFQKSSDVKLYFKTLISLIKTKETSKNKIEKELQHSMINGFLSYFNGEYKTKVEKINANEKAIKTNLLQFNKLKKEYVKNNKNLSLKYKKAITENNETIKFLDSTIPSDCPKTNKLGSALQKEMYLQIHSIFCKKHVSEKKELAENNSSENNEISKLKFLILKQSQSLEINKFKSEFYKQYQVLKPVYLKFTKEKLLIENKILKTRFVLANANNLKMWKIKNSEWAENNAKIAPSLRKEIQNFKNDLIVNTNKIKTELKNIKFEGKLSQNGKLEIKTFQIKASNISRQTSKIIFHKKSDPFIKLITKTTGAFERNRYLDTLKNSFGSLIPIIIIGAIGVLLTAAVFGANGNAQASLLGIILPGEVNFSGDSPGADYLTGSTASFVASYAQIFLSPLNFVTLGSLSLYAAFLIGFFLAKKSNHRSPFFAGLFSLMAFLISTINFSEFTRVILGVDSSPGSFGFQTDYFGAQGLLSAIVVSAVTAEIFLFVSKSQFFSIKLPQSVPKGISDSFNSLLPGIVTILLITSLNAGFVLWGTFGNVNSFEFSNSGSPPEIVIDRFSQGFTTMVATFVNDPLIAFASSDAGNLPIAFFYVFTLSLI